ncbi:MAG: shikimate dehydrogenase [Actinomycetota bacterium]|nr:shikimate dehydrogenase [Actinomycetota bacterium]
MDSQARSQSELATPEKGFKANHRSMAAVPWPNGGTKVFAVVGNPIDHSLSPVLLNAAFTAMKLDAVYVALRVTRQDIRNAVLGIRSMGLAGVSVTMPHKESIIGQLDRVTDRAAILNSVNCVFWEDGHLVGDSTDGPALVASLEAELGDSVVDKSVMVIGTGGAARAIVLALAEAAVREIVVVGRREDAVARVVELGSPVSRGGRMDEVREIEILVNATSVGMSGTGGEGRTPIPSELLCARHFVYDIIYHPPITPLVKDALASGARASNGLGMLVHQAARAFSIWTGQEPPLNAMFDAARSFNRR